MVCLPLVFTASLHGHALGFSQTGPRCHHDADNPTSRLEWNLKPSRSNCRLPASNATLDCNACQLLNLRDMLKTGQPQQACKGSTSSTRSVSSFEIRNLDHTTEGEEPTRTLCLGSAPHTGLAFETQRALHGSLCLRQGLGTSATTAKQVKRISEAMKIAICHI